MYCVIITFQIDNMYILTISDQTDCRILTCYDDVGLLASIPSRNKIIAEHGNRMSDILQQYLSNKQLMHFIPTAVSNKTEYINKMSTYILHISGCLINGQKTVINIMSIRLFFDIIVLEEVPLSIFKSKLVRIISNTLKSILKFRIRTI